MITKNRALNYLKPNKIASLFIDADERREKQVGDTVTYIKNRNINFTEKCVIQCRFCHFNKEDGETLSINDVITKIDEANDITEVCLQGGINPELSKKYYLNLIKEINENFDVHIHAFSPQEIYYISNGSVKKTLKEFKEAGLDSLPGTAAEILKENIRTQICPDKLTVKQWTDIIKKAHDLGIKTTSTMMYGHIETWKDKVDHLFKIKKIQEETNGFTEFIPLPYINKEGKKTTKHLEDMIVIALARNILGDSIKNIQASWIKLGPKKALESLYYGANDLGGTLIEENITNKENIEFLSQEKMNKMIKEAGRLPKERNTLYREV